VRKKDFVGHEELRQGFTLFSFIPTIAHLKQFTNRISSMLLSLIPMIVRGECPRFSNVGELWARLNGLSVIRKSEENALCFGNGTSCARKILTKLDWLDGIAVKLMFFCDGIHNRY
jgi:hypothetical protein